MLPADDTNDFIQGLIEENANWTARYYGAPEPYPDTDPTPPHGTPRPLWYTEPETCDDPNCLVCCDQDTFNRLTKMRTEEVRDWG